MDQVCITGISDRPKMPLSLYNVYHNLSVSNWPHQNGYSFTDGDGFLRNLSFLMSKLISICCCRCARKYETLLFALWLLMTSWSKSWWWQMCAFQSCDLTRQLNNFTLLFFLFLVGFWFLMTSWSHGDNGWLDLKIWVVMKWYIGKDVIWRANIEISDVALVNSILFYNIYNINVLNLMKLYRIKYSQYTENFTLFLLNYKIFGIFNYNPIHWFYSYFINTHLMISKKIIHF